MIRTSIKFKFSLFLACLLLATVLLLSVFVLKGIRDHQQAKMEEELLQQTKVANLSIKQAFLTSAPVGAQPFLRNRGQQLALDLAVYTGLHVVLYDNSGRAVGDSVPLGSGYDLQDSLSYALMGKIAYQHEGRSLYYLAPMQGPSGQMGVIQLQYSLVGDEKFYGAIARLFLFVGAAVLFASFALGYLYFRRSAMAVISLNRAAERIRKGEYLLTQPLKRKDELGQLSQGIYYMSKEIENNISSMKQFIGNISHEFKTPLTSIKAYVELMSMYGDDETMQRDAIDRIGLEADRLVDMVDKVLRLSALEQYEFEQHSERVEVGETLEGLVERMKAKASRYGVTVDAKLRAADIWADRESFGHIMINLLDNAIKYNVPGGRIDVSSRTEGNKVVIEVADTGIGIPAGERDRIFEPFYTANKDRSRQTGGTGLGLALVRQLADKQKGTVRLLESKQGALFRLEFPRMPPLVEKGGKT